MRPIFILFYLIGYFLILSIVTWLTTRKSDKLSFYLGNKKSPWPLVAFGMIGTSISGVTFISVTGMVAAQKFSYIQFVLGLIVGYQVVAFVLLPLYYRLNLTSIYTYLDIRFGKASHRTGSFYFLIARTLGAAARLYLVVEVLDNLVFKALGIPFALTVAFIMMLIFAYTVKGGIKTIVYTDSIQTTVMIAAVFICIWEIKDALHLSLGTLLHTVSAKGYTQVVTTGPQGFLKSFISGVFICIGMTGLDQDLMQKNLSIKNVKDAQKNMVSFSVISFFINLLFLTLGAFLAYFVAAKGIFIEKPDLVFGNVATRYFSSFGALIFVMGLVAISFASADSALTALTTSLCIDILAFKPDDGTKAGKRRWVHFGFTVLSFLLIVYVFKGTKGSVINIVYLIGSYTYGPLIGMYAFGLFLQRKIKDGRVPFIAVFSALMVISVSLWTGYQTISASPVSRAALQAQHGLAYFETLIGKGFGNEVIIYNAMLTFVGLLIFSTPKKIKYPLDDR